MYVSSPLKESAPWIVHPSPRVSPYSPLYNQYFFNATVDYKLSANELPNGHYNVKKHPSEIAIAYDVDTASKVYVDSTPPVLTSYHHDRSNYSSGYSKSALAGEGMHVAIASQGLFHHWGYSTCHWIRSCSGTEQVGSACSAMLAGVIYNGFCFESAQGSLECGHTIALDDKFGNKPIVIGAWRSPNRLPSQEGLFVSTSATRTTLPQVPYRCERGSVATSAGSYVGKRLPIGGCLNTSDAFYDVMADVHIPAYCAQPHDFKKGCMFPGATNFDPTARQPTNCYFGTRGCTSPTAVNYNSEASIDDGSCIQAVLGCTISSTSYVGVAQDTPGYKSGFYGSALPNVGKVSELTYNGPTVLNYLASANVLSGCSVAVEGCMDSNAANYDPAATVSSSTWCIPKVRGCMMPNVGRAPAKFSTPEGNKKDGIAANFNPLATLHVPSMCTIERVGCMDSAMYNFDPRATMSGSCYSKLEGCLNPLALNFGCTIRQSQPCSSGLDAQKVQIHSRAICQWEAAPPAPPAPPPPPLPPGRRYTRKPAVVTTMLAGGDVSDYDEETLASLTSFFASKAGVDKSAVTITVTPASVLLEIIIVFLDLESADAASQQIANALGNSAASASAALGIVVQSEPFTSAKEILVEGVAVPETVPAPLIIILGFGVAIIIILLIILRRRHMRRVHAASHAPSMGDELVDRSTPVKYSVKLPPKPEPSFSCFTPHGQLMYAWGPDPPGLWDPSAEILPPPRRAEPARRPHPQTNTSQHQQKGQSSSQVSQCVMPASVPVRVPANAVDHYQYQSTSGRLSAGHQQYQFMPMRVPANTVGYHQHQSASGRLPANAVGHHQYQSMSMRVPASAAAANHQYQSASGRLPANMLGHYQHQFQTPSGRVPARAIDDRQQRSKFPPAPIEIFYD